jgi:cytochrome P450/NADPH-cytochrome P450 reductase
MSYSAGDYLCILPTNPAESVKRVLKHFGLSEEATITIKAGSSTTLPTGKQVQLMQILAGYVELSQPASKRNLETLIDIAKDETKAVLQKMAENYKETIMDRRVSVLDLLYANPSLDVSLSSFLNMVPSMRVRQYSISSTPLWNPGHVTLTISVINAPASSGSGDRFLGVASNFLANLQPGDMVQLMVRPSPSMFSLPADVTIPLVLLCTGSGIAPMRGFIQERALQIKSGRKDIGKILLFFGCRYPDQDYLYSDSDLKEWAELGAVDVRPAFSRATDKSEGCRYIQDRILKDGEDVKAFYNNNAKVSSFVAATA